MDRALLPEPLTIELTMMLVIFLTSINYLVIWFQNRGPMGLLWMLASSLLSCLAFGLRLALRGHPGTVIPAGCLLVALSCTWIGFRTIAGRPPWWPALAISPAIWLLICCIPGFFHPPATRFAVAYLLAGLLLALALRELWPTQARRRTARWLLTAFLGLQILLCLAWGLAQAVSLGWGPAIGSKAINLPVTAFTVLSFTLIMSYAFVALVKEQSDWDLWQASRLDALTGLGNRRDLDDTLDKAVQASRRTGAPLALIMIDVDQFKTFNDHYGHPAGDACLRAIAGALRGGLVRREDAVSRYGGEEFTVILAGTREAEAVAVAERLRLAVRAMNLPHAGRPEGIVTISLGVAVMAPGEASAAITDAAALIDAADHALYRAKEGRDRVASSSGPVAVPPPAMAAAPLLRLDPA